MAKQKVAVIVGAGIAGLATAHHLNRIGWRTIILERSASRRRSGYLIFFRGEGMRTAERMGILESLTDRLGGHGQWWEAGRTRALRPGMKAPSSTGSNPSMTLLRSDLEEALYQSVHDESTMHFATTVESIHDAADSVMVATSSGRCLQADLLIGADGIHSQIRADMFGPNDQHLYHFGDTVAAFEIRQPLSWLTTGNTVVMADAGRSAWVSGFAPYPVTYLLYRDRFGRLQGDPRAAVERVFAGFGGFMPDLLDALANADNALFDRVSQIRMPRWHHGHVALIGDSAWCTTLYSAYGSSLAIEAGDHLATQLQRSSDVVTGLDQWERRMRPRVAYHQRRARRMRRLFLPDNEMHRRFRAGVIALSQRPGGSRIANVLIPQPG